MTNFSVVLPVHNEAEFLKYSLPSVYKLQPQEVILILDRCTDKSQSIAKDIASRYENVETRFYSVNGNVDWVYRPAYLFRMGYHEARNNLVLTSAADIILDSKITGYFGEIGKNIGLISFSYLDYPVHFRNLLKRLLIGSGISPPSRKQRWLSGVFIFSKKAWLETEDQEAIKHVERAQDTYLHVALLKKYKSKCVITGSFHLRPRENNAMHYLKGRLYWTVAKRSFILTLLSALFYLRLGLIKGYIHARMSGA